MYVFVLLLNMPYTCTCRQIFNTLASHDFSFIPYVPLVVKIIIINNTSLLFFLFHFSSTYILWSLLPSIPYQCYVSHDSVSKHVPTPVTQSPRKLIFKKDNYAYPPPHPRHTKRQLKTNLHTCFVSLHFLPTLSVKNSSPSNMSPSLWSNPLKKCPYLLFYTFSNSYTPPPPFQILYISHSVSLHYWLTQFVT